MLSPLIEALPAATRCACRTDSGSSAIMIEVMTKSSWSPSLVGSLIPRFALHPVEDLAVAVELGDEVRARAPAPPFVQRLGHRGHPPLVPPAVADEHDVGEPMRPEAAGHVFEHGPESLFTEADRAPD